MGRKVGLELEDIVASAARMADGEGLSATTLTAIAADLGIRTPSLYNHVDGIQGVHRLLAMHGARVLLETFQTAAEGLTGSPALRAIARADRSFAMEHPGLYEAFLPAPGPDDDPELYQALAEPVFFVAHVLLEMGLPQSRAIHLIRALRSLLHGFLDLESKAGFGIPVDVEDSFAVAVELMIKGIESEIP